jgi:hypothetical protein
VSFPLRHRLQWEGPYATEGDFRAVGLRVVDAQGLRVHRYAIVLSFEKEVTLAHRYGFQFSPSQPDPQLPDALFRWGVRRVEALLGDTPPTWDPAVPTTRLVIEEEDLPDLVRAWGPKLCDFQLREHRRLICSAAIRDDPTAVSREGIRTLAPTSDSLCQACATPDADYLCSHFVNPQVVGIDSDAGIVSRRLIGAMCQLGKAEITANPGQCHAGGHGCWERVVVLNDSPALALSPLSLVAAIDYLDASWRASSFSGAQRLFKHRHAEILADLAQPCTTRSDFRDRVSELDSVLKTIDAPKDDASFTKEVRDAGPLVRLKHFVFHRLTADEGTAATAEDVRAAIDQLLAINKLRVAIQHPGTANTDLSAALATFGIPFAPTDWGKAWRRLEASTVSALTVVARSLT